MSKYSWTNVQNLEDAIASGRFNAEALAAIPGLAPFSAPARRDAALAELLASGTGWVGVKSFGAAGDGVADDTAAIQAAVTAIAASGVPLLIPAGRYRLTAPITGIGSGLKVLGSGDRASTIVKAHTGVGFTVTAAGFEVRNMGFDADVATNSAYGTSGAMVNYPGGAFTASDGRLINVTSVNLDQVIGFGPDGGSRHQVIGGYWLPYTTTAGSEGLVYRTGVGGPDTGARFRTIVGLTTDGQIDQTGALDSEMAGVNCRRVITTSTTTLLGVQGGIWGSLDIPVTIDGAGTRIMGIRVAGDITLSATMSGACVFVGNTQTSGTFTNNTGNGVCVVLHHPLSATYDLLDRHILMGGSSVGSLIKTCRRVSPGDADSTFDPLGGVSHLRYGTALTANRTVTLTTTGAQGNIGGRVSRPAGDTGGPWTVDVGGLITLSTGEWCDFEFNGSTYEITAFGALA